MNAQLKIRPELGNPEDVFRFITMSHQTTMALGLRRMIDRGKNARSLYRVLTAIAEKHLVVRRCDYARRFGNDQESIARGKAAFHALVGRKCSEYPADLAKKHRTQLRRLVLRVADWVDRRIAHNDPQEVSVPKLLHLRHAWKACWVIHCRYLDALTGTTTTVVDNLLLSPNWQQPLTVPWFLGEAHRVGSQERVNYGDDLVDRVRGHRRR